MRRWTVAGAPNKPNGSVTNWCNGQPGHSHSVAGLEGPPVAATWERGLGERERELGRKGEERERERERERLGRGSPTPGNAARWSFASWMA